MVNEGKYTVRPMDSVGSKLYHGYSRPLKSVNYGILVVPVWMTRKLYTTLPFWKGVFSNRFETTEPLNSLFSIL